MLEIETGSQRIAEIKNLRLQSRLDYGDLKGARQDNVSESHTAYLKEQFVIGCLALVVGLLAGNFALSGWPTPADSFCFLDDYARYACAYSGFGATIFGSMMVNDFILPMSRDFTVNHQQPSLRRLDPKSKFTLSFLSLRRRKILSRKYLQSRSDSTIVVLVCLFFIVFPTCVSSIVSYTATVIMTVQTGVSAGVTGSIPYEMGSRQSGFFGAVFWNPTNVFYEVTRVEFNASTATNQVFSRVEQGTGNSYPENGWVLDSSRKIVYLSGSFYVAPHSAIEFYVRIAGNRRTEIFQVQIRATANGTDYQKAYSTSQQATDSPFSVLWLGQGPIPQFVTNAVPSTEQTFYVTLQEDSKTTPINAEGIMTINVPAGFTNIADFGGLGWGSASIIGNKIEVSNTEALLGSYRTYAFTATTPSSKGLYQLDVSFGGTPKENPRGNFAIMVNDNSPTQIILQCDSYNPAQTRGWTKVGSSPYLNEIDYLSNYIHTSTRLAEEGYYGFQDSSSTEITSVFLDINGMTVRRNDVIRIRIYDGTTWIDLGSASLPTSFGWTSIDITSYLNTWGKINAAQLWFQFSATNNAGHVYVDCARLRVND